MPERHGARWLLRVSSIACAALLTGVVPASASPADEPTRQQASEAKRLFAEGSALYLEAKYARALELLQSSYGLANSPNSELLVARCLRELGRPVEAVKAFASAEGEARRRVAAGSPRYAQTADTAAAEGAAVRATLGSVHIHLEGIDPGTVLEVDGLAVELPPDGDSVISHAPGSVTVSLRAASGQEQTQTVTVTAGADVTVGFSKPEAPQPTPSQVPAPPVPGPPPAVAPTRPPPPEPATGTPWIRTAAIASGVVTVAGAAAFAGFGLASHFTFDDLSGRCGGHCGSSDRAEAQTGKNEQLAANVSLVVGSVAAAATAVFVVFAIEGAPRKGAGVSWSLRAGPAALGVAAEFQ